MDRKERERITEIARQKLIVLKTARDFLAWWGDYFALLSSKTLGTLINNERLRIDAANREFKRRMAKRRAERAAVERDFPYSVENLRRRGQGKDGGTEWMREHKAAIEDRKALDEEDARSDEITFSEGEGERENYSGERA